MTNSEIAFLALPLVASVAVAGMAWAVTSIGTRKPRTLPAILATGGAQESPVQDTTFVFAESVLQTPEGTFFKLGSIDNLLLRGLGEGTGIERDARSGEIAARRAAPPRPKRNINDPQPKKV